jgi:O-antigen/teichoic acid export membrane protein
VTGLLRTLGGRDIGRVAGGNLAIAIALGGSGIVLARSLDADDRGFLALLVLWSAIGALVLGVGHRNALVYLDAAKVVDRDRLVSAAVAGSLISSAVFVGGGVLAVVMLNFDSTREQATLIALASGPLSILGGVSNGLAQSVSIRVWNRIRNVTPITNVVFLLILYMSSALTLVTASLAYTASVAVAAVYGTIATSSEVPRWRPRWDPTTLRRVYSYGARSMLSGVAAIASARLDLLMLAFVTSTDEVGVYAVALGMSGVVSTAGLALTPGLVPIVAREPTVEGRRRIARGALLVTAAGMAVISLVGILLTPSLVPAVLGDRWEPAVVTTQILLVSGVVYALNATAAAVLGGLNRPGMTGIGEFVSAVITLALIAPMARRYGSEGAAVTSVVAYLGTSVVLLFALRSALRLPVADAARGPSPGPVSHDVEKPWT